MGNKVVINVRYGGFGVSKEVCDYIFSKLSKDSQDEIKDMHIAELKCTGSLNDEYNWSDTWTLEDQINSYVMDMERHDPLLIEAIENIKDPSGDYGLLMIVEIDGDRYIINEYDGSESIETPDTILWNKIE